MKTIKFFVRWCIRGVVIAFVAMAMLIIGAVIYQEVNKIGLVVLFRAIGLTLLAFVVSAGVVSIGVSLYAWVTGD